MSSGLVAGIEQASFRVRMKLSGPGVEGKVKTYAAERLQAAIIRTLLCVGADNAKRKTPSKEPPSALSSVLLNPAESVSLATEYDEAAVLCTVTIDERKFQKALTPRIKALSQESSLRHPLFTVVNWLAKALHEDNVNEAAQASARRLGNHAIELLSSGFDRYLRRNLAEARLEVEDYAESLADEGAAPRFV